MRIRRHIQRVRSLGCLQAIQIVFSHRLHVGGGWPNAAELRTDAETGGGVAEKRTHGRHRESRNLRSFRGGQTGSSKATRAPCIICTLNSGIGIPTAHNLEPVEGCHLGTQRTDTHVLIQGDDRTHTSVWICSGWRLLQITQPPFFSPLFHTSEPMARKIQNNQCHEPHQVHKCQPMTVARRGIGKNCSMKKPVHGLSE